MPYATSVTMKQPGVLPRYAEHLPQRQRVRESEHPTHFPLTDPLIRANLSMTEPPGCFTFDRCPMVSMVSINVRLNWSA